MTTLVHNLLMSISKLQSYRNIRPFLQEVLYRRYSRPMNFNEKVNDLQVQNEPILQYLKGSKERKELDETIEQMANCLTHVPIVVGDEEITTKKVGYQVMPHCHQHQIAKFHLANAKIVKKAITVASEKQAEWDHVPIAERIAIWQRGADLLAGKYRSLVVAATMLGQSKTVYQAEIDSACELIDFLRWNAFFLKDLLKHRPVNAYENTINSNRYRGLDGFVAAISPFNFTAIGGNLAYTPALCGNCVLWKPATTSVLSNWIVFQAMREAGVPPGVVNFLPCDGPVFGDTITAAPKLAAINFTGSVPTFQHLWGQVGKNITKYDTFPRLMGECGGKNFHFIHPSADLCAVVAGTIRSAFEYMGQKCSACSRLYVPESVWPKLEPLIVHEANTIFIGDVRDYRSFASAVIDERSFNKINEYIEYARKSSKVKIIAGGGCNDAVGYYICPTIVVTKNPEDKLMKEEIFGPVLTVYVYKDSEIDQALCLVRETTKFALTGSIFAEDEDFICRATHELKSAAGNFYINTKSTSAVVAQQPFGGGKLSGTNDKPGGPHYVLRFLSPQSIKQDLLPDREIIYPHMKD